MAENPNDKALREKLLSAEYAYDPGAWAAMEQLMERKKKRGLLWWWLSSGAVAVALLVSAGAYFYAINGGQKTQVSHQTFTTGSSHPAPDLAGTSYPNAATTNGTITSSAVPVTINGVTSPHSSTTPKSDGLAGLKPSSQSESTFVPFRKTRTGHKSDANKQGSTHWDREPSAIGTAPGKKTMEALYADDLLSPAGKELDNDLKSNNISDKGENTQALPSRHRHRIALSYSLGAETGVFASYAHRTWSSVPTWSLGLSQQFNIGRYFAITNSILYSEVNFKVNNPAYPVNQYNELNSYRSKIKELAIPIGIKVYPYTSRRIRLSAGISYVHHFKVNESFTYQLTPKAPATAIPITTADFPGVNSFEPGYSQDALNSLNPPITNAKLMEYYSLGNGKRYYGSLQYTIGVDILLPHHISITAEPALRMSVGKIKLQNSRVFDVGMNAGIRYTF